MIRKSLDLGCNDCPRNPYGYEELYGADLGEQEIEGVIYKQVNLALAPIPFPDNYFDCVSAFDFIEHIPRQLLSPDTSNIILPFISLMNEIWRVLKPNGFFYAVTPVYPHPSVFQDPTHVNIITNLTHEYFCGELPGANIYGFTGKFTKLRAELIIPKMAETADKTTSKSLYKWQKKIINPSRFSHFFWELRAEKNES
ncbi:MAG: methyltransferase domain-containing protein [Methylococcales bacterium]|nr:methyltransferase domain-containing protein [Methylococcales bacterium]